MMGADHLVRVAAFLRDGGTPFHPTIYGTGELEAPMRASTAGLGLEQLVCGVPVVG
jgi:hypothetical protein